MASYSLQAGSNSILYQGMTRPCDVAVPQYIRDVLSGGILWYHNEEVLYWRPGYAYNTLADLTLGYWYLIDVTAPVVWNFEDSYGGDGGGGDDGGGGESGAGTGIGWMIGAAALVGIAFLVVRKKRK